MVNGTSASAWHLLECSGRGLLPGWRAPCQCTYFSTVRGRPGGAGGADPPSNSRRSTDADALTPSCREVSLSFFYKRGPLFKSPCLLTGLEVTPCGAGSPRVLRELVIPFPPLSVVSPVPLAIGGVSIVSFPASFLYIFSLLPSGNFAAAGRCAPCPPCPAPPRPAT